MSPAVNGKQNKLTAAKNEPTRETFSNFLLEKCELLEALELNNDMSFNENKAQIIKAHSAINEIRTPICSFCNKEHIIYNCKDFFSTQYFKSNF